MQLLDIVQDGGNHLENKYIRWPNKIYKCIKRMEKATKNLFNSDFFLSLENTLK